MTALSADRPSSNPQDDLFGPAPFADSLANSIYRYPGNQGLVLAFYGPWGSAASATTESGFAGAIHRLHSLRAALDRPTTDWRRSGYGT
jgi:hypothetical protein